MLQPASSTEQHLQERIIATLDRLKDPRSADGDEKGINQVRRAFRPPALWQDRAAADGPAAARAPLTDRTAP